MKTLLFLITIIALFFVSINTDLSCQSNNPGCQDCTNSTFCKMCNPGYFITNQSNTANICTSCTDNCTSCTGRQQCDKCSDSFILSSQKSSCISKILNCYNQTDNLCYYCNENYTLGNITTASTPSTSLTCYSKISNCTTQSTTNCAACQDGFILSSNSGKCYPVIQNCQNQTDLNCTTCINGYVAQQNQCFKIIENCQQQNQNSCSYCKAGFEPSSSSTSTISLDICVPNSQCLTTIPYCTNCESAKYCLTCNSSYIKNTDQTKCSLKKLFCSNQTEDKCYGCEDQYLLYNNNCVKIIPNCQNQTGDSCSQCNPSFTISIIDKSCFGVDACKPIIPGCVTCDSQTTCSQCNDTTVLATIKQKCYPKIPNCLKQSDLSCSSCLDGYALELTPNRCKMANCLYQNLTDETCLACNTGFYQENGLCTKNNCTITNCNICGSNTACKLCQSGFLLSTDSTQCALNITGCLEFDFAAKICKVCASGYTLSSTRTICLQEYTGTCISNCAKCLSQAYCGICEVGYFLQNNQCVKKIPYCLEQVGLLCKSCYSSYQLQFISNTESQCINSTCSLTNLTNCAITNQYCKCKTCFSSYYNQDGICVTTCASGLSLYNQTCYKCADDGCKQCFGNLKYQCLACQDGYKFTDKQCVKNAQTCTDSQFQLITSGAVTCVNVCPLSYYPNSSTKLCESCNKIPDCRILGENCSCSLCSINSTYLATADKISCVSTCPSGYFQKTTNYIQSTVNAATIKNECVKCFDKACSTCKNVEQGACITCNDGYDLISGSCLQKDIANVYAQCNSSFFKLMQNNALSCVASCPEKYYANQPTMECKLCLESCKTCATNGTCQDCAENYFFDTTGNCVKECPVGFALDITDKKCKACDSSCSSCSIPNNKTQCTLCGRGTTLTKNYDTEKIQIAINNSTNNNTIVKFLLLLKINTNIKTILTSYQNSYMPSIGTITELANSPILLILINKFQNDANYKILINNNTETLKAINPNTFYDYVKQNSQYIEELSAILKYYQNNICQGQCQNGYYNDGQGVCQACSKYCKTCTGYGDSSCTSCWSEFIFNTDGTCSARATANKQIVEKGTEATKSEINSTNDASALKNLADKYKDIFVPTNTDNIANISQAFTSDELGTSNTTTTTTDSNTTTTVNVTQQLQAMKNEVRAQLVQQVSNLANQTTATGNVSISQLISTAKVITDIDLSSANDTIIKQLAGVLDSTQIKNQTIQNTDIKDGLDLLSKIITIKQQKEKILNSGSTTTTTTTNSSNSNSTATTIKKVDSAVIEQIKNSISSLATGFLKNNDTAPIKVNNENFAINLEKTKVDDIKTLLTSKYLAAGSSSNSTNSTKTTSTTTIANDDDTKALGKVQMSADSITALENELKSLKFGDENKKIIISQIVPKDSDFASALAKTTKKVSSILDFSLSYINEQNVTEKIKVVNKTIDITMPIDNSTIGTNTNATTVSKSKTVTKQVCQFYNTISQKWDATGLSLLNKTISTATTAAQYVCRTTHLTEFVVTDQEAQTSSSTKKKSSKTTLIIIVVVCGAAALISLAAVLVFFLKKNAKKRERAKITSFSGEEVAIQKV